MYRPNDPLDDDALSYTSTEFEDPVQSTPSYAKDRDLIANVNIGGREKFYYGAVNLSDFV